MSGRESRESDTKRSSHLERDSSSRRSRRDGKPATERTSHNLDGEERLDQDNKSSRGLKDALPLESPVVPESKVEPDTVDRALKNNAVGADVTKHSSEATDIPRSGSFFKHGERDRGAQGGRSFGLRDSTGHIKNLPDDVLLDIISRLPVDSVMESKVVCKKWGKLLHGKRSFFANMHVSRQLNQLYGGAAHGDKLDTGLLFGCTADDDLHVSLFYGGLYNDKLNTSNKYEYKKTLKKVRHPRMHHQLAQQYMVGSCNGLICLGRNHNLRMDPTYVYNPVTGEYVNLPKLIIPKGSFFPRIARGFGYVHSTNEYKVVRIFYPNHNLNGRNTGQVQVYTLGSGCGWRTKSTTFPYVNYEIPASFANGSLYWFNKSKVYAFDLAKEEMRMVPSPPPCSTYSLGSSIDDKLDLVVLRGDLCFFHQTLKAPHMEIWSLKRTGVNESWCKHFSIVYEKKAGEQYIDRFWPIILTQSDEIILTNEYQTIHCYDPKTTTWKEIVAEDPHYYLSAICVNFHVNTFVSLKTLGEKSNKQRCKIKIIKPDINVS